ncbi:uncharacterized protein LOC127287424 [Leptopilina boulardi]|uniref:uncharacterized protein LOC127287424 n=1 Tax=Leptopilina boulardi TaxID=63433 RepID=UPI0021F57F63|nr:uncharacterized protein LOC127287424 [Leptopilina boulardi]
MDKNLFIIHNVEKHPCLYDKHRNDYKDNLKKHRAWKEIANKYAECFHESESVDRIKSRWNYLRKLYMQYHKTDNKYMPSGSGAKEDAISWEYYNDMQFLDSHVRHRRTHSNFTYASSNAFARSVSDNNKDAQEIEVLDDVDELYNMGNEEMENQSDEVIDEEGIRFDTENDELLKYAQSIESMATQIITNQKINSLSGYEKIIVDAFRKVPQTKLRMKFDKIMDIIEQNDEP